MNELRKADEEINRLKQETEDEGYDVQYDSSNKVSNDTMADMVHNNDTSADQDDGEIEL